MVFSRQVLLISAATNVPNVRIDPSDLSERSPMEHIADAGVGGADGDPPCF